MVVIKTFMPPNYYRLKKDHTNYLSLLLSSTAALKHRLAQQTTELKDYKGKVQKLQNDLIKKNDKEKDYLKVWIITAFECLSVLKFLL